MGLEEILPEPEPMRQDSDTDTLWRLEPDISRTNPGAACVPPATMLVQCVLRVYTVDLSFSEGVFEQCKILLWDPL